MFNYNGNSHSATPSRVVTGQYLARTHMSKWGRARLAAAIIDERVRIANLTDKQIAALCGVSITYVYHVRGGARPKPTLADRLAGASPSERVEAAARLGPAVVWDTMISPLLDQERASQQAAE
jgi:hypothetical protein